MKRLREESEPFLPYEMWLEVVQYLDLNDIASFLTLLSVEKSAVYYVREKMSMFIVDVANHIYVDRSFIDYRRGVVYNEFASIIGQDAISWLARTIHYEEPKDFCKRIFRYATYCLLDERYQTVYHWSNLLSFFRLCQLYKGNEGGRNIDLLYPQDKVSTVFHFDKKRQRVIPLIERKDVMTIVATDSFDDLRDRAIIKIDNKYGTSKIVKRELYMSILNDRQDQFLMFCVVYDILKEELELRKPSANDLLAFVVIKKDETRIEHILLDDDNSITSNCFVYEKGDLKAATIAMLLYKNESSHAEKVYERFFIDKSDEMICLKDGTLSEKIHTTLVDHWNKIKNNS